MVLMPLSPTKTSGQSWAGETWGLCEGVFCVWRARGSRDNDSWHPQDKFLLAPGLQPGPPLGTRGCDRNVIQFCMLPSYHLGKQELKY